VSRELGGNIEFSIVNVHEEIGIGGLFRVRKDGGVRRGTEEFKEFRRIHCGWFDPKPVTSDLQPTL